MTRSHLIGALNAVIRTGLLMMVPLTAATSPALGVEELAAPYTTVYASPDPHKLFAYSPGITRLENGRLVATLDLGGPGMAEVPEPKGIRYGQPVQAKVFTSDDHGTTWQERSTFPFMHERPFMAGKNLYVLGHCGDLMVSKSTDGGDTWSQPAKLTDGEDWTAAPCNVLYANGCVYLVMSRRMAPHKNYWPVAVEAPILMRGKLGDDLTVAANWTMSEAPMFRDLVSPEDLEFFGIPYFATKPNEGTLPAPGRAMAPMGWLETNVVQFKEPNHLWCDPTGKTFHLFSRAHTGGTGYACLAKVVEQGETPGTGAMVTQLEVVPSGKKMMFLPMPGGQMKFHVVYDEATKLYWLLSTQATDSMTRIDKLPADRYNLPNNQRSRMQLHFSRNMVDWCFAGMVAMGAKEDEARHYASMDIDGDDLVILSRSGDEHAVSSHDANIITFHRVRQFRKLVY